MSRYERHISLSQVGVAGQQKIAAAKVLVIGAGGLGSPILQYLAAAGVGVIGIVDFDTVELSNLQRQVLFKVADIDCNKALKARDHLLELNPDIEIIAYPVKLNPQNTIELCQGYDIVVDATDNFSTRYLVSDTSIVLDKPLVYGAIYKFEGQVTVFNYENGPSYRCLFKNPPKPNTVPNCQEIGVLGVLPGIIGSLQANEVLKLILGVGIPLSRKLYCFNALTLDSYTISISPNEEQKDKVRSRGKNFLVQEEAFFCTSADVEINLKDVSSSRNLQYVDIRESYEMPRMSSLDVLEIPLDALEEQIHKFPKDKKIIVFCQSGIRSKRAVALLRHNDLNDSWSLKGGVSAFAKAYEKTL